MTHGQLQRMAFYQGVFRPHFDGTMTAMSRFIGALEQRNIAHIVLTPIPPLPGDTCSTPVIPVRSVPFPPYPRYRIAIPDRAAIWRALDEFDPQLVQIGAPDLGGKCVLRWARYRGVPVIGGYHTHFPTYLKYYRAGFLEELLWADFRAFYNACACTLVPSLVTMAELESHGIERVAHWPRGVDTAAFTPDRRCDERRAQWGAAAGDIVIAYAGRFVSEKNVDEVAAAFAIVADRCPRARFVFIGDGPRLPILRKIIPGAVFTGYLTTEALWDAYAAADLFCFASTTEAFGNVVLEAMASGLAVVTVRDTATGEHVAAAHGGLLVDAPDPGLLAAALGQLCADDDLRGELAGNALAYARSQSWEEILERQCNLYQEILGRSQWYVADEDADLYVAL